MYREIEITKEAQKNHNKPPKPLSDRAIKSREKYARKLAKEQARQDELREKRLKKITQQKPIMRHSLADFSFDNTETAPAPNAKKFWTVTNGWQIGVFDDYMTVDRVTRGFKGAEIKVFYDRDKALAYCHEHQKCSSRNMKRSYINREDRQRRKYDKQLRLMYCRSCGKPINKRTKHNKGLCLSCSHLPTTVRGNYKVDSNLTHYDNEIVAPEYIYKILGDDKEFIKLDGSKRNPNIYFRCKRCNEDFAIRYNELKQHKSHDCEGLLSSGEAIIKSYLDKHNIPYKTQYDTFRCVNPITGHVMPYDFELSEKKAIIEVQGEQHRQFIEVFHGTEDGFKYQLMKDARKKAFALDNGYEFVEIWYDQFKDGPYKQIMDGLIKGQ